MPPATALLCLSVACRVFFSGEGDGTGEDLAFSFGVLFGVRGSGSESSSRRRGAAVRALGGRLNAGRVSALAVDSRRGFGMQRSKGNYLHISDRMIRTVQMLVCSSSVLMCFRVRGILLGLGKSMSLLTEAELA